ncbi:hypothetical protein GGR50DRAFT_497951 [Xylaria sp. CBS 124048]|nr:hypothetical protein GGR50DRAFT_497951 [Xylaria sp. CBS 124048]
MSFNTPDAPPALPDQDHVVNPAFAREEDIDEELPDPDMPAIELPEGYNGPNLAPEQADAEAEEAEEQTGFDAAVDAFNARVAQLEGAWAHDEELLAELDARSRRHGTFAKKMREEARDTMAAALRIKDAGAAMKQEGMALKQEAIKLVQEALRLKADAQAQQHAAVAVFERAVGVEKDTVEMRVPTIQRHNEIIRLHDQILALSDRNQREHAHLIALYQQVQRERADARADRTNAQVDRAAAQEDREEAIRAQQRTVELISQNQAH